MRYMNWLFTYLLTYVNQNVTYNKCLHYVMSLTHQSGRCGHNVPIHSYVFYQTCNSTQYFESELILMQSWSTRQGIKRRSMWVRTSKVKVTRGQRYIWRLGLTEAFSSLESKAESLWFRSVKYREMWPLLCFVPAFTCLASYTAVHRAVNKCTTDLALRSKPVVGPDIPLRWTGHPAIRSCVMIWLWDEALPGVAYPRSLGQPQHHKYQNQIWWWWDSSNCDKLTILT